MGEPTEMATYLSPSNPSVEMRATESCRMRSWNLRLICITTSTSCSARFGGNSTAITCPACIPATRTAAPARSPLMSAKVQEIR